MKPDITGITRVRNESLIIDDTIQHFLRYCDSIILYDDASTDATPDIAEEFGRVTVIRGKHWFHDRPAEETRHRALLLGEVKTEWVMCFDADERIEGLSPDLSADGYRFRLFDGYMTPEHRHDYTGGALATLTRLWGPEYRDILMLFRKEKSAYNGRDQREPECLGEIQQADIRVKHYGKCLSVKHWEDTCNYYANHWPEPYRSKWAKRRGKAIHQQSDFGRPLYEWNELEKHAVPM